MPDVWWRDSRCHTMGQTNSNSAVLFLLSFTVNFKRRRLRTLVICKLQHYSTHMFDKWTEYLERGGQIDTIYSDFEQAFDKVPHRRLISKLYSYGLNDTIVNCVCDFLTERKYKVKVNKNYSDWDDVTSGISQGSVLGPLLFLIYINDLIDTCGIYSEVYVIADDAKFFRHILSAIDSSNLQYAVNALQNWSLQWLLNLYLTSSSAIAERPRCRVD